MKRFTFRLRRLLELRTLEEHTQARRLADAMQEADTAAEALRVAREHLTLAQQQVATTRTGAATVGDRTAREAALLVARRRERSSEEAWVEARRRVDEEQQRFTEARKHRRSLERLREVRREEWSAEVEREERKAYDEIASRRMHEQRGQP